MSDFMQDEKRIENTQDLIKDIKLFKEMYFNLDKELEKDFFNNYINILLYRNTILFNDRYVEMFNVITRALNNYRDVNAFYDIRCLIEIRNKYIELLHDGDMNKENDICKLSKYLMAYTYYNNLKCSEFDIIMEYLLDNYYEILDWCIMNKGVSVIKTYTREYYSIKNDFYLYVINYLMSQLNNKQIIK